MTKQVFILHNLNSIFGCFLVLLKKKNLLFKYFIFELKLSSKKSLKEKKII